MDECKCQEVIVATLLRRGSGKDESNPIRIITQVYAKDGELLMEHDPCLKEMLTTFAAKLPEKEAKELAWLIDHMY